MPVTLGDWLARAPFGLAMSSGFFSFFAHTGMLSALVARGLAPAHVAGSSAGALVGGAYAAGLAPDELARVLGSLERAQFWDPTVGAGLLAGKKFDRLLREILPVARFEELPLPAR
ncbi:MAG TPA: patatin-like phospholipase family protein, partial [Kofleriaceae bacterium]|nr:patatin-like phospholipase family protein [Kofleriaceae bacterium]